MMQITVESLVFHLYPVKLQLPCNYYDDESLDANIYLYVFGCPHLYKAISSRSTLVAPLTTTFWLHQAWSAAPPARMAKCCGGTCVSWYALVLIFAPNWY